MYITPPPPSNFNSNPAYDSDTSVGVIDEGKIFTRLQLLITFKVEYIAAMFGNGHKELKFKKQLSLKTINLHEIKFGSYLSHGAFINGNTHVCLLFRM